MMLLWAHRRNWRSLVANRQDHHTYSPPEERAHVISHGLGVFFIVVFAAPLLGRFGSPTSNQIGPVLYCVSFAGAFLASTIYHGTVHPRGREVLRKIDHIAIYYFILGSNAPYLLHPAAGDRGLIFFCIMGGLVVLGTIYKATGTDRFPWFSLMFYLILGWLGIVTVWLVFHSISWQTFALIVLGGIFYTVGTYFYARDSRRWYHTIWHIFVLAAALSHFAAVWLMA